jgi:hypothetical protein
MVDTLANGVMIATMSRRWFHRRDVCGTLHAVHSLTSLFVLRVRTVSRSAACSRSIPGLFPS